MKEKDIKLSIVCTAYNHEKYIRSALDGFVMQKTNFAFEAIVHDDASTDGTADIIREYAKKYPDIIVPIIQTENQHSKKVQITREIIFPMVRGKYIAFCEGDDYWTDENKLHLQVDFLENNPDYIACAHNTIFHSCSGKRKDELLVERDDEHDIEFEDAIKGSKNSYHTSALVIRKEWFYNMPDFYYEALKYGVGDLPRSIWYTIKGKVRFFPYNMSTYRFMSTPTSWSTLTLSGDREMRHINGMINMYEGIKKHVSDQRKELVDKIILEHEFRKLELENKYSQMKSPPYLEIWKKYPRDRKFKAFLKSRCYWVYIILRTIKRTLNF